MDYKELLQDRDFSSPDEICEWMNNAQKAITELVSKTDKLEKQLVEVTEERDSYKIFYNDVVSKPDCNTCVRECEYRPSVGKTTRFNCPLWSGNNHER